MSEGGGAAGGNHDEYYGEEEEYGEESVDKGSPVREEEYSTKKKPQRKTTINVYCTEYDIVKKAAKRVNDFKLKEIEEDHEGGVHKG